MPSKSTTKSGYVKPHSSSGFTLVELILVMTIMSIIAATAIPFYQDYLTSAKVSVARASAESLRLFLEDHHLTNGTYVAVANQSSYNQSDSSTEIQDSYGWAPNGDEGSYTYQLTASTSTWHILVTHKDGTWLRCQDRMNNCCAIGDSGASSTSCP